MLIRNQQKYCTKRNQDDRVEISLKSIKSPLAYLPLVFSQISINKFSFYNTFCYRKLACKLIINELHLPIKYSAQFYYQIDTFCSCIQGLIDHYSPKRIICSRMLSSLNKMFKAILLLSLLCILMAQSCLKANGEPVQWWVILKVPPKIGRLGFGYYDSTMKTGKFIYYDAKVDVETTAHTKTIQQINTQNLHHVAWNDQKPSGQTSSSSAHAKGFMAYNPATSKGFFIDHSLPKYPAFANGKINPTIAASQNYYGQHLACFSLNLKELQDLASYLLMTWPFVYEGTIMNTSATQNLYKLSKSVFTQTTYLFSKHDLRSVLGYTIKTIYKNDKVNGSIFEDGLTSYLTVSPLIAQTWGRPIEKAWCSKTHEVLNVVNINLNGISWTELDDHSKWVVGGNDFACYGDMNRMSSQWKRGGAFFCLMQPTLVAAMKSVIVSHDSC